MSLKKSNQKTGTNSFCSNQASTLGFAMTLQTEKDMGNQVTIQ